MCTLTLISRTRLQNVFALGCSRKNLKFEWIEISWLLTTFNIYSIIRLKHRDKPSFYFPTLATNWTMTHIHHLVDNYAWMENLRGVVHRSKITTKWYLVNYTVVVTTQQQPWIPWFVVTNQKKHDKEHKNEKFNIKNRKTKAELQQLDLGKSARFTKENETATYSNQYFDLFHNMKFSWKSLPCENNSM